MKINISSIDRILRAVFAITVGILFTTNVVSGTLGIALCGVAAILLFTSMLGFCPIYAVFGFSTCPVKSKQE